MISWLTSLVHSPPSEQDYSITDQYPQMNYAGAVARSPPSSDRVAQRPVMTPPRPSYSDHTDRSENYHYGSAHHSYGTRSMSNGTSIPVSTSRIINNAGDMTGHYQSYQHGAPIGYGNGNVSSSSHSAATAHHQDRHPSGVDIRLQSTSQTNGDIVMVLNQGQLVNGNPPLSIPESLVQIFDGLEVIVSHPGSSQYSQGSGVSACGLAALNCVKVVLAKERDGIRGTDLVEDLMSEKTTESIVSVCSLWKGDSHLEVEEIYKIPYFDEFIELENTRFGRSRLKSFTNLLTDLRANTDPTKCGVVVITRPPEIIVCFKIPTQHGDVFAIFDSHSRPIHPRGAGFIFSYSLETASRRLGEILAVDDDIFNDPEMEWQAELLGSFSGHFFTAKELPDTPMAMNRILLELSVASLAFRKDLAKAYAEVDSLKSEKRDLEFRMDQDRRTNEEIMATQSARIDSLVRERDSLYARAAERSRSTRQPRLEDLLAQNERLQDELNQKNDDFATEKDINEATRQSLGEEVERLQRALADQTRRAENMVHQCARIDAIEEENENLKAVVTADTGPHEQLDRRELTTIAALERENSTLRQKISREAIPQRGSEGGDRRRPPSNADINLGRIQSTSSSSYARVDPKTLRNNA